MLANRAVLKGLAAKLQVSGLGAAELAVSILGPWDKAPKAGRVAYEHYTAAIAALLGGESSSEVRVRRQLGCLLACRVPMLLLFFCECTMPDCSSVLQ